MASDLTMKEKEDVVKNGRIFNNAVVLSNIVELTSSVISKVHGQDASYTSNNDTLGRGVLNNLVASRLKAKLQEAK